MEAIALPVPVELAQGLPVVEVYRSDFQEPEVVESLAQALAAVQIPPEMHGKIRIELTMTQGQVRQVIFDRVSSDLETIAVLRPIRQQLLDWESPKSLHGVYRARLRVETPRFDEYN